MRNSKLGLRALGLCVLGALSMMAVFAVSAQAVTFQINGKNLLATASGEQEGTGFLLVKGRNLKLTCTAGDVETGHIAANGTEGLAKIQFLGCTAENHKEGGKLADCEVLPIIATAIIKPIAGPAVLATADPGPNFTVVNIHGKECPLPLENPVTGAVVASVDKNNIDPLEDGKEPKQLLFPLLLFSEAIQLASGDVLKFGGFASYINASALVKLLGEHLHAKLGVL